MQITLDQPNLSSSETQLEIIRELMLTSSRRGEWQTLAEIAMQTEFGEASISAQLRHLRKSGHGRYRVEKRRRRFDVSKEPTEDFVNSVIGIWEYQVFPCGSNEAEQNAARGSETHGAQICDGSKQREKSSLEQGGGDAEACDRF